MRKAAASLSVAIVLGCTAKPDGGAGFTEGSGSVDGGSTHGDGSSAGTDSMTAGSGEAGSDGDASSGTDGGDSGSGDDGPPRLDVGPDTTGGGSDTFGDEMGCDKVDFLFLVDSSSSMQEEQANLIANWPAFVTGIEQQVPEAVDWHVGVVPTYEYEHNVPACTERGGLVVQTGGPYSSERACGPYADGSNFMTHNDDLSTAFSCAAQVGAYGAREVPIQVMQEVIGGVHAGAGECNEGFLRKDALLIVVILTDEADGPRDPETPTTAGTPPEWFQRVVDAKFGIEENVVVLSLIRYYDGPCPPTPPNESHWNGEDIKEFTELFTYGSVGGICEADFGPYFESAVNVIAEACDGFVEPEG